MKVALLTGSATGLGAVIAHHLAIKGYAIALNYRQSKKQALETLENLKNIGAPEGIAIQADLSDPLQTQALIETTLSTFGHIDVLIHTAGPFLRERKPLTENSYAEWFDMINGNLSSTFFYVRISFLRCAGVDLAELLLLGLTELTRPQTNFIGDLMPVQKQD